MGSFLIDLLQVLLGFIAGAVVGFFVARHYLQKYLKQNPPINYGCGKIEIKVN